jgi:hypothetical protein
MILSIPGMIDKELLRQQRRVINKLLCGTEKVSVKDTCEALTGIANLLDDIQDELDNAADRG